MRGLHCPRSAFMTFGFRLIAVAALACLLTGCQSEAENPEAPAPAVAEDTMSVENRIAWYSPVRHTTNLSHLSENDRKMIPLLIEAAKAMDDVFWLQAYGPKVQLLNSLTDPAQKRYAEINYGPWDRMEGLAPFVSGYGPKPDGAQFYPQDMKK